MELSAPEHMKLEPAQREPSWLQVTLKLDEKRFPPKRRIWRLEVTVPPNTPTVRSFDEPDAVVLKIVGPPETLPVVGASTVGLMCSPSGQGPFLAASAVLARRVPPERFVRIPVDGHVTGR